MIFKLNHLGFFLLETYEGVELQLVMLAHPFPAHSFTLSALPHTRSGAEIDTEGKY